MQKIVLGVGLVVAVLLLGFWFFTTNQPALSEVVNEVTLELEDKLDDLAVSLRHDDLSATELLEAHASVIAYLDRINLATEKASGKRVTREELRDIQDALGRLAQVLETYLQNLADLDQRVALIDPSEYPDHISPEERERTVLMTAIQTITDLTEVATVEGEEGNILEDTIFDDTATEDEESDEVEEAAVDTSEPTGRTAGDAIHLDVAPVN